jgi:hypothetical protein
LGPLLGGLSLMLRTLVQLIPVLGLQFQEMMVGVVLILLYGPLHKGIL